MYFDVTVTTKWQVVKVLQYFIPLSGLYMRRPIPWLTTFAVISHVVSTAVHAARGTHFILNQARLLEDER